MALVIADRVRETSTTTGTGTFTLDGAVAGFRTFSSAVGNSNTCYYTITIGSSYEIGLGTVGAGTLTRDTILKSSNSNNAVNFGAGVKDVFVTYPADKAVYKDSSDNVNSLGTISSGTWNGSTIAVSYGGTGVATLTGIVKGNGTNAFTAATAGSDYLAPPAGTSILKANGGGALANAVSGTDYAPATSGTSILYGNGSGGFSNVTVGAGLTFSSGTLSSTNPSNGLVRAISINCILP